MVSTRLKTTYGGQLYYLRAVNSGIYLETDQYQMDAYAERISNPSKWNELQFDIYGPI